MAAAVTFERERARANNRSPNGDLFFSIGVRRTRFPTGRKLRSRYLRSVSLEPRTTERLPARHGRFPSLRNRFDRSLYYRSELGKYREYLKVRIAALIEASSIEWLRLPGTGWDASTGAMITGYGLESSRTG